MTTPSFPATTSASLSLDEALTRQGVGRFHYDLTLAIGWMMMCVSLQLGMLSFLGIIVQCQAQPNGKDYHSPFLVATNASSFPQSENSAVVARPIAAVAPFITLLTFLGMMIGTPLWGSLADTKLGRKPIMLSVSFLACVISASRAFLATAQQLMWMQFFLGFTLAGFDVGFNYFMEFFPTAQRAKWSLLLLVFWSLGVLVGVATIWLNRNETWQKMTLTSTIPMIINVFSVACLPGSPRFLLSHGRMLEARDVLIKSSKMNGKPFPSNFELIEPASLIVRPCLPVLQSWNRVYRRTALSLHWIWFSVGIAYYSSMMMSATIGQGREVLSHARNKSGVEMPGHSCGAASNGTVANDDDSIFKTSDYVDSVLGAVAELIGLLFTLLLIDRTGRIKTARWASLGFTFAFGLLAIIPGNSTSDHVLLFMGRAMSNAAQSTIWVYTPEVFPSVFRATAFSINNCFSYVGSMLSPFVAQTLVLQGAFYEAGGLLFFVGVTCVLATFGLNIETLNRVLVDSDMTQNGSKNLDAAAASLISARTMQQVHPVRNVELVVATSCSGQVTKDLKQQSLPMPRILGLDSKASMTAQVI